MKTSGLIKYLLTSAGQFLQEYYIKRKFKLGLTFFCPFFELWAPWGCLEVQRPPVWVLWVSLEPLGSGCENLLVTFCEVWIVYHESKAVGLHNLWVEGSGALPPPLDGLTSSGRAGWRLLVLD